MTDKTILDDGQDENIVMSEELTNLFNGTELTEGFKEKASVLFESAVKQAVKAESQKLQEEFDSRLQEAVEAEKDSMANKINDYLDFVVEEWFDKNEIAIENGIKSEVTESFIENMTQVFRDHYVELPEEKRDIVSEMAEKVDSLNAELNELHERLIESKAETKEYRRSKIVSEASKGLADTEVEKLVSLAEGIDYVNDEDFQRKIGIIKEAHFGVALIVEEDEDGLGSLNESEHSDDKKKKNMKSDDMEEEEDDGEKSDGSDDSDDDKEKMDEKKKKMKESVDSPYWAIAESMKHLHRN